MGTAYIRRIGSLLLLCLAASSNTRADQTTDSELITFRFAPPVGMKFVQTLVTTREKIIEGIEPQIDRSESETAVWVERADAGYTLASRVTSLKATRNGTPIDDPIAQLLQSIEVVYRVDYEGQIQGIEGYDGILEGLKRSLPPEVVEAIAPMISEEALVARDLAEWNGRIGDFAGAEVEIGESIEGESPFSLPNGEEIVYLMRVTFAAFEDCPAGTCVRVEHRYDSDAAAFGALASQVVSDVASAAGADSLELTFDGTRVSGFVSRLIDPRTMLIYHETMSRTIVMGLEVPGRGQMPATLTEEREYTFAYP